MATAAIEKFFTSMGSARNGSDGNFSLRRSVWNVFRPFSEHEVDPTEYLTWISEEDRENLATLCDILTGIVYSQQIIINALAVGGSVRKRGKSESSDIDVRITHQDDLSSEMTIRTAQQLIEILHDGLKKTGATVSVKSTPKYFAGVELTAEYSGGGLPQHLLVSTPDMLPANHQLLEMRRLNQRFSHIYGMNPHSAAWLLVADLLHRNQSTEAFSQQQY